MSAIFRARCKRALSIVLLALVLALLALRAYVGALPSAELDSRRQTAPSSFILDASGHRLDEVAESGRQQHVSLDDIPLYLRQAVIATEDERFYAHSGVDPLAIARAAWSNLRAGEIVSGASTIPQQLARLLLLPEERTEVSLRRKLREAILAVRLSRRYSRDEILELYLDQSYFGAYAYGVQAASRAYFDKPVQQLDLAECAMLAGLIQSPIAYNPLTHPDAAYERQRIVLDLMVKAGYLTPAQARDAETERLRFSGAAHDAMLAPHAVLYAWEQLESLLPADKIAAGGLRVLTTIELPLQQYAERTLRRHLEELNKPRPDQPTHQVQNGAVVVLDVETGGITAMVGSPDYANSDISGAVNATLALRQPGSSIKPFTYAAAFEQGYSPGTVVNDVSTTFVTLEGETYEPVNFDYRFHGPVSLRQALACSYNVVAVKLLDEIGVRALADVAHRVGITSLGNTKEHGLAMTLGSSEVQLLQLARGYATLARGGQYQETHIIERVEAADGTLLYEYASPPLVQAVEPRAAYLVTDILSDDKARLPAFGSGSPLETGLYAAVKTGTTTDWRDNWTLGYTTRRVVGVWVGNADGTPMRGISGVSGAAPVWHDVLIAAHDTPPRAFEQPEGLVSVRICSLSGKLPGIACSHTRQELFLEESAPSESCEWHALARIDVHTGLPVTGGCAEGQCVLRSGVVWPGELLPWAISEGLTTQSKAVELHNQTSRPAATPDGASVAIAKPVDGMRYVLAPSIPKASQMVPIEVRVSPGFPQADVVTLVIDDRPVHEWHEGPFTFLWKLEPGTHSIAAVVVSMDGDPIRSDPVTVQVLDSAGGQE